MVTGKMAGALLHASLNAFSTPDSTESHILGMPRILVHTYWRRPYINTSELQASETRRVLSLEAKSRQTGHKTLLGNFKGAGKNSVNDWPLGVTLADTHPPSTFLGQRVTWGCWEFSDLRTTTTLTEGMISISYKP